jgi:flavodoxin
MNALVVYFSKFGNTREVAEAIAATLGASGTTRSIPLDELVVSDLAEVDLVVMGSPTHRMNLPEEVRPLLAALPRRTLHRRPVAAFDTSYKMSAWLARFTAARKLDKRLRKLGGKRLVPPETFHVVDRDGPLYDGEIDRAKAWASLILEQLN